MGKAKLLVFFDFFRFLIGICSFSIASGGRMDETGYILKYRPLSRRRILRHRFRY